MGNHVLCLDVDKRKIEILNSGGIPIHEHGLEEMVKRNAADGRLQFTTDIAAAVYHGTLQFIGVGTPPDEDGSADLQYVLAAARSIGQHMTDYKVIVDKSTVPVGTADRVRAEYGDSIHNSKWCEAQAASGRPAPKARCLICSPTPCSGPR
jgi:UDPglucose 6-dehydrogenase